MMRTEPATKTKKAGGKRPPRGPRRVDPESLLRAAIEEALEEARSHEDAAVDILVIYLRNDSELLEAFAQCGQLRYAVRRLLGDYLSAQRAEIISFANTGVSGEMMDGGRAKRIAESGFLYFILPIKGNPFIKDATVEQLRDAARRWTVMGQDYLTKGRFCHMAAEAKDGGKELTADLLHNLWDEARAH